MGNCGSGSKQREHAAMLKLKLEMGEMLTALGLRGSEIRAIQKAFRKADHNSDGFLAYREFCVYYEIEENKFSKRVFDLLNESKAEGLILEDFVVGLYNYLTFGKESISLFMYDLIDTDRNDGLTMFGGGDKATFEKNAMKMASHDVRYLKAEDPTISIKAFTTFINANANMTFPLYALQRKLILKSGGPAMWKRIAARRKARTEEIERQHQDEELLQQEQLVEEETSPTTNGVMPTPVMVPRLVGSTPTGAADADADAAGGASGAGDEAKAPAFMVPGLGADALWAPGSRKFFDPGVVTPASPAIPQHVLQTPGTPTTPSAIKSPTAGKMTDALGVAFDEHDISKLYIGTAADRMRAKEVKKKRDRLKVTLEAKARREAERQEKQLQLQDAGRGAASRATRRRNSRVAGNDVAMQKAIAGGGSAEANAAATRGRRGSTVGAVVDKKSASKDAYKGDNNPDLFLTAAQRAQRGLPPLTEKEAKRVAELTQGTAQKARRWTTAASPKRGDVERSGSASSGDWDASAGATERGRRRSSIAGAPASAGPLSPLSIGMRGTGVGTRRRRSVAAAGSPHHGRAQSVIEGGGAANPGLAAAAAAAVAEWQAERHGNGGGGGAPAPEEVSADLRDRNRMKDMARRRRGSMMDTHTADAMDATAKRRTLLLEQQKAQREADEAERRAGRDAPAGGLGGLLTRSGVDGDGSDGSDGGGSAGNAGKRKARRSTRRREREKGPPKRRRSAPGAADHVEEHKVKGDDLPILKTRAAKKVMRTLEGEWSADIYSAADDAAATAAPTGARAGLKTSLTKDSRATHRRRSAASKAAQREAGVELVTAETLVQRKRAEVARNVSRRAAAARLERRRSASDAGNETRHQTDAARTLAAKQNAGGSTGQDKARLTSVMRDEFGAPNASPGRGTVALPGIVPASGGGTTRSTAGTGRRRSRAQEARAAAAVRRRASDSRVAERRRSASDNAAALAGLGGGHSPGHAQRVARQSIAKRDEIIKSIV